MTRPRTQGYYLKTIANSRDYFPRYLCIVDTETLTEQVDETTVRTPLDFGVARFRKWNSDLERWTSYKELVFENNDHFWDVCETYTPKGKKLWVVAHNMGGFDALVLQTLEQMAERGWTLRKHIMGCPPFLMDYEKDGRYIQLCDSLNWQRSSLAAIGKAVGLEKGEDPGELHRLVR